MILKHIGCITFFINQSIIWNNPHFIKSIYGYICSAKLFLCLTINFIPKYLSRRPFKQRVSEYLYWVERVLLFITTPETAKPAIPPRRKV